MTWQNGLMYGAGFGGIEIILVSLNSILAFLFLQFAPGFLPSWYETELRMTPLYIPFLIALKQVWYLCLYIGLSVMVLQTFVRESYKYLFYAAGLHSLPYFVSVLLLQRSIILSETSISIFAVIGVYIVWKFRKDS
ncbi:MAG: YhfC family intramembrane metalloprotease [Theionarchaea archaeon]|nr:YhfC family intramembrane metalloprotease [Theionarchaea archaeon]